MLIYLQSHTRTFREPTLRRYTNTMASSLLRGLIVATVVICVVVNVDATESKEVITTTTTTTVADTPGTLLTAEDGSTLVVAPPPPFLAQLFDRLGLSKKAREPLTPIKIPTNLEGRSPSDILIYNRLLYNQRVQMHNRMTRHLTYNMILLTMMHFFGANTFVKGFGAGFFWLNTNFRHTINADWVVHQRQLAAYLVEYARVQHIDLTALGKSKRSGTKVITLYLDEGKKNEIVFPVWMMNKGDSLPAGAEIRSWPRFFRNWLLRK